MNVDHVIRHQHAKRVAPCINLIRFASKEKAGVTVHPLWNGAGSLPLASDCETILCLNLAT